MTGWPKSRITPPSMCEKMRFSIMGMQIQTARGRPIGIGRPRVATASDTFTALPARGEFKRLFLRRVRLGGCGLLSLGDRVGGFGRGSGLFRRGRGGGLFRLRLRVAAALQHGGEEAVRGVAMRPQREVVAGIETHALFRQHVARADQHEVGMRVEELLHDRFVLGFENAAGRVDQTAAALEQTRGARENRQLLGREFGHRLGRLAPLEVGIAAQRAQPRARRIDQHAVDLADQALDLGVVFAVDQHRIDVREAAARKARLELRETAIGDVERVETARRAHHRAERQGLAARARTEVHHHLAAARRDQRAQQLAAFVLHFEPAVLEGVEARQRGLARHAHAVRRERRLARLDAGRGQRAHQLVAVRLDRIRAQVERRRIVERGRQLRHFGGVETRFERLQDPLGQIELHALRQARRIDLRDVFEPVRLGVRDERTDRRTAGRGHQAEQREAARRAARAAFGQVRELHATAQHGEHGFGDHAALTVAELRMLAEKTARDRVGGAGELEHIGEQRLGLSNQKSMQPHAPSPALCACASFTSSRKSHCGSGGESVTRPPSSARRPSTNQRTARG
ncbi:hypothetical protein PT2222_40408 [Paraburkholderia tropica]